METTELILIPAIFLVAVLYSSVGHAGASGYLAVMALASISPTVTRPTALILNIFVAAVASIQFYRADYFEWKTFWPFAVGSVPMAFLGGMITLPTNAHKIILGLVLLVAAARLAWKFAAKEQQIVSHTIWLALGIGALIGLLSGLTGVGGGIFLTPILLLTNWTETKKAAGISAMFILVNSAAGLAGNLSQATLPSIGIWIWVAAAVVGGLIGSTLGSRYFDILLLRRVLSFVLLVAGLKLIFT